MAEAQPLIDDGQGGRGVGDLEPDMPFDGRRRQLQGGRPLALAQGALEELEQQLMQDAAIGVDGQFRRLDGPAQDLSGLTADLGQDRRDFIDQRSQGKRARGGRQPLHGLLHAGRNGARGACRLPIQLGAREDGQRRQGAPMLPAHLAVTQRQFRFDLGKRATQDVTIVQDDIPAPFGGPFRDLGCRLQVLDPDEQALAQKVAARNGSFRWFSVRKRLRQGMRFQVVQIMEAHQRRAQLVDQVQLTHPTSHSS